MSLAALKKHESVSMTVGFVLIAELAIVLFFWLQNGITLESVQAITRFSGRLSLIIFGTLFIFGPIPGTLEKLLSERHYGVFALAHGIHLIELSVFLWMADAKIIPYRIAGGILAYCFIFVMPVLQAKYVKGKISSRFYQTLESVYSYYLWFIFFMTYLPRLLGKMPHAGGTFTEHVGLMTLVCLLLIIRIAVQLNFRSTR